MHQVTKDHPNSLKPAKIIQTTNPKLFTLPCLSCRNPNKGHGLSSPLTLSTVAWPKPGSSPVPLQGMR